MDNSRLRFPRLNLARGGATQLAIFGGYEVTEDRLALLSNPNEVLGSGQRGPGVVSFTRYKPRGASGRNYVIGATSHVDDESREIHVSISYREAPAGVPQRPSGSVPEGEILAIAQAMGIPKEVGGFALFEFDDREPSQLWFPLPVTLAGKAPEDTIEVRGVRGAKIGIHGPMTGYEFILDRPVKDKVVLQIDLSLEGIINPEALRKLFHRAESIARDLVAQS